MCGTLANAHRISQQIALAIHVIPIIALHLTIGLGDHHAAQAVPGRRITADKTVAVAIDTAALMGAQRSAIGILDPAVGSKCGRFTGQRLLDCLLRRDIPWVEQVEILNVTRHQSSIRQARRFVFRGVFGNGQGGGYGLTNRLWTAGRGAGRTLALANVQGDTESLITIEFDGFDFALAHRGRQALLQGHRHFTGTGPLAPGFSDDLLDLFLQCRQRLWADAFNCTHAVLHSNSAFG